MVKSILIRRQDDRSLYDLFEKSGKSAETASSVSGLSGQDVDVVITYYGVEIIGELDFSERIPESGKYSIIRAELYIGTSYKGSNQYTKTNQAFTLRRGESGQLDQIDLPSRKLSDAEAAVWKEGRGKAALLAAYEVLSDAIAPSDADPETPIGQLTNFASSIDSSFRGFTQNVETTLQSLADQRSEDVKKIESERQRLREEIEQERTRVLKQAESDIAARIAKLDNREKELDNREADLEIKSHKDARRKLFSEIQSELLNNSKAPARSKSVLMARWAIFIALIIASGLSGGLALQALSPDALPESSTQFQIWVVILKPVGLSIVSLGSIAAAVQWLRHFYTRDLRAAEDMQRFGHDMARAAWIMEAFLEMKKEHDIEDIPESWMNNATEGLFQRDGSSGHLDESTQALAALLGLSASAKVGPDGFEATFGRRQLRKMANTKNPSEE